MTTSIISTTDTTTDTPADTGARAERMLRRVLTANAVTSGLAGAVALAFGPTVDELLGTGHPGWVRLVGLALVVFAVDVALIARASRPVLRRLAPIVSAADAAWVAFTLVSIVAGWYSTGGAVAMGVVGLGVIVFAVEQVLLARRLG